MHTLSLFPAFFDYQVLGIFLLRVTLGFTFVYLWYKYRKGAHDGKNFLNIAYLLLGIVGALFVIGLYTQGAAIAAALFASVAALIKWHKHPAYLHESTPFYFLLAIVSFAFLFFGAGAFAIDLPL